MSNTLTQGLTVKGKSGSIAIARSQLSLRVFTFVLLGAGAAAMFLAELSIGAVTIPVQNILSALIGAAPADATWARIVVDLRLPRATAASPT
jgi:iron complex transport system permease protein